MIERRCRRQITQRIRWNIPNYSLLVVRILLTDPLQHINFQFGCFSVFLQILNDLQSYLSSPSVCLNTVFKINKHYTCCILAQLSSFHEQTYLLWSKHCTTFPKVPSPNVSRISSVRGSRILMTEHFYEPFIPS